MEMLKRLKDSEFEAGCDEAGRGCLAGPVFAAAVILGDNFLNDKVIDSKQINHNNRLILREFIKKNALAWSVSYVKQEEIDRINILNASILAMHKALDSLEIRPEFIVVDGNRFKNYHDIPYECVVKGDSKLTNIAAASILAKTYRDDYMQKIHEKFPVYNWKKNKGYPTSEHREAIKIHGITDHHRKSFRLFPTQLELNL